MDVEFALCAGTIVVHRGRVVTCTDPLCEAGCIGMGAVLDRHCWFVACSETLGPECPICRATIVGPRAGPDPLSEEPPA